MEKQASKRLYAIDGLRGWGALVVYLFHLSNMICHQGQYSLLDDYFFRTPLQIIVDGTTAVYLFFILSGFSLSYKFFKGNGDREYLQEAAEFRYLRLLIPVFFTLFIPYFLVHFDLIPHGPFFLGAYNEKFSFVSMLKFTFFELPFMNGNPAINYNPVLWTIHVEFFASFVVFAFLALFGKSTIRFIVYLFLMQYFYSFTGIVEYCFLFFLGVLICDLYFLLQRSTTANVAFKKVIFNKRMQSILVIALLIFTYRHLVTHHHRFYFTKSNYLFYMIFLITVLYAPVVNGFFSSKFSQFLGRISYSLYLTHYPIMCSLSCFSYIILKSMGCSEVIITLFVFLITTPVSFYVAYLFTIFVEESLLPFIKKKWLTPFRIKEKDLSGELGSLAG